MWRLINPNDRRSVLTGFHLGRTMDSYNANPYTKQFVLMTYAAGVPAGGVGHAHFHPLSNNVIC